MGQILKLVLLLLVVSLVLTACALAPPAPVDEPDTAAAGAEADKVIYLGAAVSETGKFSREGKDTRQGYGLWLDWVNNEYGGIKVGDERYRVELIMYDDEGDPDTAARLVEKLINEDRVDFLLGPYSSSLTQSASAIAEKYGKIMIEGTVLRNRSFNGAFRTCLRC